MAYVYSGKNQYDIADLMRPREMQASTAGPKPKPHPLEKFGKLLNLYGNLAKAALPPADGEGRLPVDRDRLLRSIIQGAGAIVPMMFPLPAMGGQGSPSADILRLDPLWDLESAPLPPEAVQGPVKPFPVQAPTTGAPAGGSAPGGLPGTGAPGVATPRLPGAPLVPRAPLAPRGIGGGPLAAAAIAGTMAAPYVGQGLGWLSKYLFPPEVAMPSQKTADWLAQRPGTDSRQPTTAGLFRPSRFAPQEILPGPGEAMPPFARPTETEFPFTTAMGAPPPIGEVPWQLGGQGPQAAPSPAMRTPAEVAQYLARPLESFAPSLTPQEQFIAQEQFRMMQRNPRLTRTAPGGAGRDPLAMAQLQTGMGENPMNLAEIGSLAGNLNALPGGGYRYLDPNRPRLPAGSPAMAASFARQQAAQEAAARAMDVSGPGVVDRGLVKRRRDEQKTRLAAKRTVAQDRLEAARRGMTPEALKAERRMLERVGTDAAMEDDALLAMMGEKAIPLLTAKTAASAQQEGYKQAALASRREAIGLALQSPTLTSTERRRLMTELLDMPQPVPGAPGENMPLAVPGAPGSTAPANAPPPASGGLDAEALAEMRTASPSVEAFYQQMRQTGATAPYARLQAQEAFGREGVPARGYRSAFNRLPEFMQRRMPSPTMEPFELWELQYQASQGDEEAMQKLEKYRAQRQVENTLNLATALSPAAAAMRVYAAAIPRR